MKFDVTAVAADPSSGDVSAPRTEQIDTETNSLFADCSSPWEVEDAFTAFWNRLDQSWESAWPDGKEKILVLSVTGAN